MIKAQRSKADRGTPGSTRAPCARGNCVKKSRMVRASSLDATPVDSATQKHKRAVVTDGPLVRQHKNAIREAFKKQPSERLVRIAPRCQPSTIVSCFIASFQRSYIDLVPGRRRATAMLEKPHQLANLTKNFPNDLENFEREHAGS